MAQKRVILLDNPFKMVKRSRGAELFKWIKGRAEVVAHNLDGPLDIKNLPEADFLIVLGGDGTILGTVRALGKNEIPIIGVNMGKLGFLTEFSFKQLQEQFEHLMTARPSLTRRVMLNCQINRPNQEPYTNTAVNEMAVIAGPPFRMIEVSVSIGGEHLALCAGDGIIIATPTGSTAYNLSAGGPILAAGLKAVVITPLAAHSLSFRPIVVDLAEPINLRFRNSHQETDETQAPQGQGAVVVIDGQDHVAIGTDDEVCITASPASFHLVHNTSRSQWHILNTKLNWGALPNYTNDDE
ncbi:MAG: NAD(+)/NADH kinase [Sedimentisphaerales bacterium]|nr:NAD(+)/NADH kinase [Sedimentisphaerales bacterium]